jgi:hypothetical protein
MRLKTEIITKIKSERKLIVMLMTYFNLGEYTIKCYVKQNHHYLLIKNVLLIMAEYFGVSETDLIEEGSPFIPISSKVHGSK